MKKVRKMSYFKKYSKIITENYYWDNTTQRMKYVNPAIKQRSIDIMERAADKALRHGNYYVYNKLKSRSNIVQESLIGRGISWARNPANPHTAVKNNEYRQRELDRRIERENQVNYGLDEIYKDNSDKKDYPDLSKQYVHI